MGLRNLQCMPQMLSLSTIFAIHFPERFCFDCLILEYSSWCLYWTLFLFSDITLFSFLCQMTTTSGRRLDEEEWFHGVLPREEVQKMLQKDGDYLVRESKNRKTGEMQYVLSVMWNGHKHFIIQGCEVCNLSFPSSVLQDAPILMICLQGCWKFEGDAYPTIQELIVAQHRSNAAVTKKSEAIIRRPILRPAWELLNDDIELIQKIGNVLWLSALVFGRVLSYFFIQSLPFSSCRVTLGRSSGASTSHEGWRWPWRLVEKHCRMNSRRSFCRKDRSSCNMTTQTLCASSGLQPSVSQSWSSWSMSQVSTDGLIDRLLRGV